MTTPRKGKRKSDKVRAIESCMRLAGRHYPGAKWMELSRADAYVSGYLAGLRAGKPTPAAGRKQGKR